MFDQDDHPSVPTWLQPERGAQGRSRMPPAAPAKSARPRQPRAQRYADLPETPIPPAPAGLPPRQKPLTIGGESPFRARAGRPGTAHPPFQGILPQPVEADLALRWKGSASEMTMTTEITIPARQRA